MLQGEFAEMEIAQELPEREEPSLVVLPRLERETGLGEKLGSIVKGGKPRKVLRNSADGGHRLDFLVHLEDEIAVQHVASSLGSAGAERGGEKTKQKGQLDGALHGIAHHPQAIQLENEVDTLGENLEEGGVTVAQGKHAGPTDASQAVHRDHRVDSRVEIRVSGWPKRGHMVLNQLKELPE